MSAHEVEYVQVGLVECSDSGEVESLRQQLADMTAERDAYMQDCGREQDRKREVAQKLAASQKREVTLRDGLKRADDLLTTSYDHVSPLIREALAATADLDGLILCHAEPVTGFQDWNANKYVPLYRAWEPKP